MYYHGFQKSLVQPRAVDPGRRPACGPALLQIITRTAGVAPVEPLALAGRNGAQPLRPHAVHQQGLPLLLRRLLKVRSAAPQAHKASDCLNALADGGRPLRGLTRVPRPWIFIDTNAVWMRWLQAAFALSDVRIVFEDRALGVKL